MAWWGGKKDPPKQPEAIGGLTESSNVVELRPKKISDANRAAVHALLDDLLDQISENEYLVLGIEAPEEPDESA